MRFGLSLCPEVGRWHDTVGQARLAEDLGFDSVWLPEHHLMAGYAPNPLLGIAGLVEATQRITLGTNVVIAPFVHPVRLAEDSALLQEMSDGRFVLGAGLGYRQEEFSALGVPYAERAGRLTETLEIVRRLWTDEHVDYPGRYFALQDVTIYPRPVPPPPLWIGGWAAAALRRAARLGDVWFPGPTADIDKVKACLETYDAALDATGRSRSELPIFREVWVSDTREHLERGTRLLSALYRDDYVAWQHRNLDSAADIAADRFIVGSPDQVAAQLVRLRDELGMTHIIARLHFHGIDQRDVERAMLLLGTSVRQSVREVPSNA
jgi:probable F420-dependent oxidoreductase